MFSMIQPVGAADSDGDLGDLGDLDDLLRSSFGLLAEATCVLAGFTIVSLMVRTGEFLHNVAVAGNDDARAALVGTKLPISVGLEALELGTPHGLWVFLPGDRTYPEAFDEHSWIPSIEASDDPDRWHPEDALIAPLFDDAGDLLGALSLDLPTDGRRPQGADWDRLQVYAEQARNGLLAVLDRLQVAQQLHHLESARDLIRAAIHVSNEQPHDDALEPVLRRVGATLLTHFGLCSAWFHVFGGPGLSSMTLDCGPQEMPLELGFVPYGESIARRLWNSQELGIMGRSQRANVDETNAEAVALATAYLGHHDVESMLYAPLGAGSECLGLVILIRPLGAPSWTDVEREAILEIGRDLGGLIAGFFARQRDAAVLADLRALETYKSEMVSTVSHELKNPLAAIRTNLELLEDAAAPEEATRVLGAVRRSADRMATILKDLQALATPGSTAYRGMAPVDLAAIVRDACAAIGDSGARPGPRITLSLPEETVLVRGAATELDRLAGNLVNNAVKYSSARDEIRVALARTDTDAVLTVADEGIGISAADQALLFTEFFRSHNAEALLEPGTGLGLAIVRRIVERHGGRIEVDSRLGEGSTFRVHLPLEIEVR